MKVSRGMGEMNLKFREAANHTGTGGKQIMMRSRTPISPSTAGLKVDIEGHSRGKCLVKCDPMSQNLGPFDLDLTAYTHRQFNNFII
jgi:hypothetical protein